MPRATLRTAAAAALLLSLGSLTACGPDARPAAGSSPPGPAPAASVPASPAPAASDTPPTASDAPAPSPSATAPATPPPATTAAPGGTAVAGLPASVWMAAGSIPMAGTYHWGSPAGAARAVNNPRFEFEQLCRSTRDPSNDLADWKGPAAQALLANPAQDYTDWQVQQTVVHFPGTSSGGAQLAYALFQGLADELRDCGKGVQGAKVRVTTTGGDAGNRDLAATVTVPESGGGAYTLHQYLSLTGRAVVEVALWSDRPAHPWPAPADAAVLKTLESPVCPALRDC